MIITIEKCLVPECGGKGHKFEFERPTLRELQRMEKVAGLDIDEFAGGLNDVLSPGISSAAITATLALVDILHRREGIRPPFEDVDVDIADFDITLDDEDEQEDQEAEQEGGEGKDPAPTDLSLPREAEAPAADGPGSGPATGEESKPRSSTTPTGSGGGSDSPSSPSGT